MTKSSFSLFLVCLILFFNKQKVHAITFDYTNIYNGNCPLYPNRVINGVNHIAIGGFPRVLVTAPNYITMDASESSNHHANSAYMIEYPLLADHYYKITINAAKNSLTSRTPYIGLFFNNFTYPAKGCAYDGTLFTEPSPGPGGTYPTPPSNYLVQAITNSAFSNYVFTYHPDQAFQHFAVSALPQLLGSTDENQQILIKNLTIEDVTAITPIFKIVSNNSDMSVACGSTITKTFSILNVNNLPGITSIRYILGGGSTVNNWTLSDGSLATDNIIASIVTLKSKACTGKATICALVTYNGTNYLTTNSLETLVTMPPFATITGSDAITSFGSNTASASYTISNTPSCTGGAFWSVSGPSGGASVVPNQPLTSTVTKAPSIYGVSVQLKAEMQMCGSPFTLTKNIQLDQYVLSHREANENNNDSKQSEDLVISPNPSSGKFSLNFKKIIDKGLLKILSPQGVCIFTKEITSSQSMDIDITGVPAGIYFIMVSNGNKLYSQKLEKRN